jgi:hypothetical protein
VGLAKRVHEDEEELGGGGTEINLKMDDSWENSNKRGWKVRVYIKISLFFISNLILIISNSRLNRERISVLKSVRSNRKPLFQPKLNL